MLKITPRNIFRDFRKLFSILCVFSLPSSINLNSWIIVALLSISLIDWVVFNHWKKPSLRISWVSFLLIGGGYFLWTSFGFLYSQNTPQAAKELEQSVSLLVFPIIAYLNRDIISRLFVKRILVVFLASVLLLILFSEIHQIILIFINDEPFAYLFRWRHSATKLVEFISLSPNYFSLYCVFLLLVVIVLDFKAWIKIVLFLLLAYFILHLVNRTGIILLALILLVVFLNLVYRSHLNYKKWMLPIVVLVGLFLFMLVQPTWIKKKLIDRNFKEDDGNTELVLDSRIPRWGAVWAVISENPFLGVGTGDITDALIEEYQKRNLENDLEKRYHAHNQYLQSWASNGIIGLMLLLMPFAYGLFLSIRMKNYLFMSFLFTFMIFSFSESTFKRQKGVVYYALFQSVFLTQVLKRGEEPVL